MLSLSAKPAERKEAGKEPVETEFELPAPKL
jgi:hypothetical protein